MARMFLTHIDLAKNQLQNAVIQPLATAPGTPNTGQVYYDTALKVLRIYDGANWGPVGGASYAAGAPSAAPATTGAFYLDTTNLVLYVAKGTASAADWVPALPYGTTTANLGASAGSGDSLQVSRANHVHRHTDTDHSNIHLNALATATADYSMGGFKLTNVATPTAGTDAANKNYVDSIAQGIEWKQSVRVATTTAGTLASSFANGSVVDGITLATGDRILIKDQATGSENGIYTVNATGAPTRATDADASSEVTSGMAVFVEVGTTNADSGWVLTTDGAITIGTTALVFTQFTGLGQITAGLGLTKSGNTLNVGAATGITVNADSVQIDTAWTGQTAITTLGTITTGTWSATTIAANKGGTGQTTYAVGDILYADSTSTLGKLADVATGNVLISGGVGAAPSWGKVGLTTHITGTLAVGNGGTGATTLTSNGVLLGNGTSAVSATAAGSADQVLRVGAGGGAPAFGAIDLSKSAAVGTSILPIANGGTNASTAAAARTNLGATTKVTGTGPAVAGTTYAINHGLGQWVTVQLFDTTGSITGTAGMQIEAEVINASTSGGTTTINTVASLAIGAYTYVIIG